MNRILPSLLVPPEALLLLLVTAGILMIVGLKRQASGLILFVLSMAFLPVFEPLIGAVTAAIPNWLLALILLAIAFAVVRAVSTLFLGKGASDHLMGTMAANMIKFSFFFPFRVCAALLRFLIKRGG